jgi:hypothetical protein
LYETSIAAGEEPSPPTITGLDPITECRIGEEAFAAVLAFEASHPALYASAIPIKRVAPALVTGSDGNYYEPADIYIQLSVSQLFARWFAIQKGLEPHVPFPPRREDLRFRIGDRAECQIVPGCFAVGEVVRAGRCGHIEFNAPQPSPYQIKLDSSEVSELVEHKLLPDGHDGYVHAPVDMNGVIRVKKGDEFMYASRDMGDKSGAPKTCC